MIAPVGRQRRLRLDDEWYRSELRHFWPRIEADSVAVGSAWERRTTVGRGLAPFELADAVRVTEVSEDAVELRSQAKDDMGFVVDGIDWNGIWRG